MKKTVVLIISALLVFQVTFLLADTGATSTPVSSVKKLKKTPADEQVKIEADTMTYDDEANIYIAEGNVDIWSGSKNLTAEKVIYNTETGEARAFGNVVYVDGEDVMKGERLEVNLNSKTGRLYSGSIDFTEVSGTTKMSKKGTKGLPIPVDKVTYHVKGDVIEKYDDDSYKIENGTITTCNCPEGASTWKFKTDEMDITFNGYGYAKNGILYLKDVPVLYLPYIIMPVKTERASGILTPSFGNSSRDGFIFSLPFYWAINRSSDATLYSAYHSKRGYKPQLEYRYVLSEESRGEFNGSYLNDKLTHNERWGIWGEHRHEFDPTFFFAAKYFFVGDYQYLAEFGKGVNERSERILKSTGFFSKRFENVNIVAEVPYFRDMTKPGSGDVIQKYPEVTLNLLSYKFSDYPISIKGDATYTNFFRAKDRADAQRVDIFPKIVYAERLANILKTRLELGYRATTTQTVSDGFSSGSRSLGFGRGDVSVEFEKTFEIFEQKVKHIVEPKVTYLNSWLINGRNSLPLMDEVDLMGNSNQVIYGISNYLITKTYNDKGESIIREGISMNLFQILRLKKDSSYISADYRYVGDPDYYTQGGKSYSDIYLDLALKPAGSTIVAFDTAYDPDVGNIRKFNIRGSYTNSRKDSFSLEYRFTRDAVNQYSPTVKIHLYEPLWVSYSARFFASTGSSIENVVILEYLSECKCLSWVATYSKTDRPKQNSFNFSVNFLGLGSQKVK